jgi:tRNA nucleotidyltransferase (CCA-adding enzyme)
MTVKKVLKNLDIVLSPEEFRDLKKKTNDFIELLKKHVAKNKIDSDVFLGGSFAKNTVARSEEYDADVFIRFDWKYEELSDRLEKILKGVIREGKFKVIRLHGSRDYFKVYKTREFTFEVIPVKRIKKPREMENVTDLSYFHVNYVKKKMKKNTAREIALAKKFFKSAGVYGAESYIHGFSGYGVECLVLNYGSFEKMLRELVRVKLGKD